jgi:exodeoxyribonuclease V alpha subunit
VSGYRFERIELERDDAPWRPLDRAVARWVRLHGGSEALARIAAWASLADGHGDTALPLLGDGAGRHGAPAGDAALLRQLRAEPMVAAPGACLVAPFVLDEAGRFYLWRNHADERAVAALLAARRRGAGAPPADPARVERMFGGRRLPAEAAQRRAVAAVRGRRLMVLTGGPGSGKTSTVLRMLVMLQLDAGRPLRIELCAPTGKAAQRLLQSLRQGRQALVADPLLPDAMRAALEQIPDDAAPTLHRLLGADPRRPGFRHHAGAQLLADVVVVDEASMVDLGLLRALLQALRDDAVLVLVGDPDQLGSVAAGSALMDLVEVLGREAGDGLVRLDHSFRAEHELVAINDALRIGDPVRFAADWQAAGERARRRRLGSAPALDAALDDWAADLAALPIRPQLPAAGPGQHAARADAAGAALQVLRSRQLLCALREEPWGALAAAARIEQQLRRHWQVPEERPWFPGRAVLVTRNDHAAGLYNGDVGLCLVDADGELAVWFEGDGALAARCVAVSQLPVHESAFAITVHKSQGSEYGCVALLLPPDAGSRVLSRQLLYTGVSRARAQVELWGSEEVLQAALASPVRRAGGLAERLRQQIAAELAAAAEPALLSD